MMKRATVYCMALLLLPSPLFPNSIVRAGEHADFTRISITVKSPEEIVFERSNDMFRVILPKSEGKIDASQLFSRIDRGRISDYTIEKSEIRFSLSCNCTVDMFKADSALVYFDVRNRSTKEDLSSSASQASQTDRGDENVAGNSTFAIDDPLELSLNPSTVDYLSNRLAYLSTQGVLQSSQNEEGGSANFQGHDFSVDSYSNVNLRSDTSGIPTNDDGPDFFAGSLAQRSSCDVLSEQFSNFSDAHQASQSLTIGQFTEFEDGGLSEAAVLSYASLLLSRGLALEAQVLLQDIEFERDALAVVLALSSAVLSPASVSSSEDRVSVECRKEVPLLVYLSNSSHGFSDEDWSVLSRQFFELPEGLQRILGPQLLDRMSKEGRLSTAKEVLRILDRKFPGEMNSFVPIDFLTLAESDSEIEQTLLSIADSTSGLAMDASLEIVENESLEYQESISEAFENLDFFSFAERDTETGSLLQEKVILELLSKNQIEEAMRQLLRSRDLGIELSNETYDQLVSQISQDMDDAAFVYWMSALDNFLPPMLEEKTSRAVSNRLSALNFDRVATVYRGNLAELPQESTTVSQDLSVDAGSQIADLSVSLATPAPEGNLAEEESDPYTDLLNSTASLRQDINTLLSQ